MSETHFTDQQGNHEERNAVGDFIYQVSTDASSAAIGGALAMGAQMVVAKLASGGKNAEDSDSTGD